MTFYTGTYLNKAEEGWSVNWEKIVLCQLLIFMYGAQKHFE